MDESTDRRRVVLTRRDDGPMNATALCDTLYRTDSLYGEPEIYCVEIEIGSAGMEGLCQDTSLRVRPLDEATRQ